MFTFIIAAIVVAGIIGIIIHASSKPSLQEIEEASKTESHTSDLPFNEDFPIVEETPTMKPKKSSKSKKTSKK
jgi:hypothetical protein